MKSTLVICVSLVFGMLLASMYSCNTATANGWQSIPIPDSCPPDAAQKDGDGNGDNINDWLLHTQTDSEGNVLELWCIDPNGTPGDGSEENPYDEYYALVYVDKETGQRRLIGKCPWEGGENEGRKHHNATGVIDNVTWTSDDGNLDDDNDGKKDDAIYIYNPERNKLIKQHSENGTVIEGREQDPELYPFNYSDLPPSDPTNDDFWAQTIGTFPGNGVKKRPIEWIEAYLTVWVLEEETGSPLPGMTVTIQGGTVIEHLVTNEYGYVSIALEPNHYVIMVQGEDPEEIELSSPENIEIFIGTEVGVLEGLPLVIIGTVGILAVLGALMVLRVKLRRERPQPPNNSL